MDLKTFYCEIGGNYEETFKRFMTDERILKFVRKFLLDGSFALLKTSLAEKKVEDAFRAAHTLKGVAQNLGFDRLFVTAEKVTNILRGGSLEVDALMPELEELYNLTITAINNL